MNEQLVRDREVTLLDLLDRILNKGVVLWGDATISVADVDLIYLGLKVLVTSVETAERMRYGGTWGPQPAGASSPIDSPAPAEPTRRARLW